MRSPQSSINGQRLGVWTGGLREFIKLLSRKAQGDPTFLSKCLLLLFFILEAGTNGMVHAFILVMNKTISEKKADLNNLDEEYKIFETLALTCQLTISPQKSHRKDFHLLKSDGKKRLKQE